MTKKRKTAVAVLAAASISLLVPGVALTATHYDYVNGIAYAEARAESNWDIAVDSEGNRVAYGPGWGAEAVQKVSGAIKAKYEALGNTGEPAEKIKPYKADSAGDAVVLGLKVSDNLYIMYNPLDGKAYTVEGAFAAKIGDLRVIGAPVTEKLTGITVTGYNGEGQAVNASNATVQVFETGILIDNEGTAAEHTGVIEKISETEYKIHPLIRDQDILATGKGSTITANGKKLGFIGDIDGTWHALRTARTFRENGKLAVEFNLRAGCIKIVYKDDWSLDSRMAYAGQNFAYNEQGESSRVMIPVENFTTGDHLFEKNGDNNFGEEGGGAHGVSTRALETYRSLSKNESATQDDLKNVFKSGYLSLLEEGIIPGYRCSVIKVWDVICVDYKYSPHSENGFDATGSAARERMYTLVYSGVQNKVYGVGGAFWQRWKEDNVRKVLGAPISNAMTNKTISGLKFDKIQVFEKGYIYEKNGEILTEYGISTDGNCENFVYPAEPSAKPSQYGVETERFEAVENNRKVVYINYQKGAVKATESFVKLGYFYDYYPGRNFEKVDSEYNLKILSYEKLYSDSDFKCESVFNDIFNGGMNEGGVYVKGVKEQLIEKVKELLAAGYFPGFFESTFQMWNGVSCQQFIYGDSTSSPWGGDSRTNVSALVYNEDLEQVFLLKDAFMERWGGTSNAYSSLGAPASDEFKLPGNDNLTFQYFRGTATQNNKAFAVSVGYNEATYFTPNDNMVGEVNPESYIESIKDLTKPLAGIKIEEVETNVKVGGFSYIEYVVDGAAADATITLKSSDESIAEVMADGSVEFKKAGTVTITVTVTDGVNTFTDKVTFNVK